MSNELLEIGGRSFGSRLLLGTGKFGSLELMRGALDASGAEIVTVALRRADVSGQSDPYANILDFVDSDRYLLLANTSGAMNAEEAVRLARLAEAAGLPKWIKLEIHPDRAPKANRTGLFYFYRTVRACTSDILEAKLETLLFG